MKKKTIVVNFYAGPGAGKSTITAALFAYLKMRGYNTEMALEYAKDVTWSGETHKLADQEHVFNEQVKRLSNAAGKVDIIVTDSPILLSILYDKDNNKELHDKVHLEYDKYNNINIFVNRNKEYVTKGRTQSLEGAIELDGQLKDILSKNEVGFFEIKYDSDNINEVLGEITKLIDSKLL